jgi:xanthine dehydrogenase accessory factor
MNESRNTEPLTFIETLAELSNTGQPFVHVTLVEATGSTPQDSGSKMLVTANELAYGTVGGGKVEQQAIEFARSMLADPDSNVTQLLDWNLQRDIGMTCGGLVKLFFEVYNRQDWRIVVFGAGHVAQASIRCLLTLRCRVVCVDSRQDWIDRLPKSSKLQTVCVGEMKEYVEQIDDRDSVICMTMGHAADRPILEAIFKSGKRPNFLGAIGSRSKRGVLIRELAESGIERELAETLVCPLGLPLGSNQPEEIAISITAQLLQRRDKARLRD